MYRVLDIFQWRRVGGTRTCIYPISFNNKILSISGIDTNSDLNAAQVIQLRDIGDSSYTSLSQFQFFEANVISDTIVDTSVTDGIFIIIGY